MPLSLVTVFDKRLLALLKFWGGGSQDAQCLCIQICAIALEKTIKRSEITLNIHILYNIKIENSVCFLSDEYWAKKNSNISLAAKGGTRSLPEMPHRLQNPKNEENSDH